MFANNNSYLHINRAGSDYSAGFSNTIVPQGSHTLTFAQRGGSSKSRNRKVNKRKIKNISNMYKMTARKLKYYKKSLKRKLNRTKRRSTHNHRRSRRNKNMKGGSTVSYAVSGVPLAASDSALANNLININGGNNAMPYNHYAQV